MFAKQLDSEVLPWGEAASVSRPQALSTHWATG